MSWYAELAKKVKQANRRLTNAKKFYGKDGHSSLTFAQKSIDYAYGDKGHAKYTLNENMTKAQLKRIEKGVDAVLNSPYFTAQGRKELEKKVLGTLGDKFDLSARDRVKLLDIFKSDIWQKIHDEFQRESNQAVSVMSDLIQTRNPNTGKKVTSDDMIDLLEKYQKSEKDKSITDFLSSLLDDAT